MLIGPRLRPGPCKVGEPVHDLNSGANSEDEPVADDNGSDYTDSGNERDEDSEDDGEAEEGAEELSNANCAVEDLIGSSTLESERLRYSGFTTEELEALNQEEIDLKIVLRLEAEKTYDIDDLKDPDSLQRALILLCQERLGAATPHVRFTLKANETRESPPRRRKKKDSCATSGLMARFTSGLHCSMDSLNAK